MDKYMCIETGRVFNSAKEASDAICSSNMTCCECPLYGEVHKYGEYCTNNSAEEAFIKLYEECGFEKVKETERSLLAEILGVEEEQEWIIDGDGNTVFRIKNGIREQKVSKGQWLQCGSELVLAALIKNPLRITILPQKFNWTEREIEIARAWKMLNPDMNQFSIVAVNQEEIEIDRVPLKESPKKCPNFFAAQKEMDVKVKDILGEPDAV